MNRRILFAAALLAVPFVANAAEPFRIGLLAPMTGPFQSTGKAMDLAVKLYIKQHGDVVAGRKMVRGGQSGPGRLPTTRDNAEQI